MSLYFHHMIPNAGVPCGEPRLPEASFQDTFNTLGICPILTPTGQITYTAVPGSLSGGDINNLTVNTWGGIESVYNTHTLGDPNRATGWYASGQGKTFELRANVTVPAGMTQMRVRFDFYMAWARFTTATPRWERLRIRAVQDTVTNQFHWIDNSLIDGVTKFAITWYHPSDWTPGTPGLRKFDRTFTTSPGADAVRFLYSFSAGGSHPTLASASGRNINAAIDNLVITFS